MSSQTRRGGIYPVAGVSVLLTIISFVLVILTIFAGNKPGFMEDYHILYFNTSTLGENLINLKARLPMPEPTATPTLLGRFHAAPEKRDGFGDFVSGAGDAVEQVGGAVGSVATAAGSAATEAVGKGLDALQDIQNDLADELAKKLGIKEFYSIHLVDLCEGDFSPKVTDPKATFDVKNCTEPFKYDLLNITALLDKQLSVGPLSLNIADLGLTDEIQDKLDLFPKIIKAIVAMYIIAAVFIVLSFFGSCAAIALINKSGGRSIIKINLGVAFAAFLFLLIGNAIVTAGGYEVVGKVKTLGEKFGLSAKGGDKFLALSWAPFVLMSLALIYWAWEIVFGEKRRAEKVEFNCIGEVKNFSGSSQDGSRSFDSDSSNGNFDQPPLYAGSDYHESSQYHNQNPLQYNQDPSQYHNQDLSQHQYPQPPDSFEEYPTSDYEQSSGPVPSHTQNDYRQQADPRQPWPAEERQGSTGNHGGLSPTGNEGPMHRISLNSDGVSPVSPGAGLGQYPANRLSPGGRYQNSGR